MDNKKSKVGRPRGATVVYNNTKYSRLLVPRFEEIKELAKNGYTNKQISDYLNVPYEFFMQCIYRHKDLANVLSQIRVVNIVGVKTSLLKRALGYDKEEKKVYVRKDNEGNEKQYTEITTKHVPADPSCIFTYLRLYDPEWVDHDKKHYEYKDIELQLKKQQMEFLEWYHGN